MKNDSKNVFGWFAMGLASVMVLSATGCMSTQKKEAAAQLTPAQQQQAQLAADRAAYVRQTQVRVGQLDQFSTQLRDKANATPKPQQKRIENAADDMESVLGDVKKSLREVTTAPPENWLDYKRDVEKSMDRAESQYSNTLNLLQ